MWINLNLPFQNIILNGQDAADRFSVRKNQTLKINYFNKIFYAWLKIRQN